MMAIGSSLMEELIADNGKIILKTGDLVASGILVFDGFEPIDVWGFTEAFSISPASSSFTARLLPERNDFASRTSSV